MATKKREPNARPGSAWDTWHKAGFEYAETVMDDSGLSMAANQYADNRGFGAAIALDAINRAFCEGARQFWRRK
jgi:hypothetical protein